MRIPRVHLIVALLAVFMTHCAACIEKTVHPQAIMHHDMGVEYLKQGQCEQAEERCRLALEYGPNTESAFMLELES